ncbi:MAG: DUF2231 domain-containing protein [Rubrobacteraceae bacterium]
MPRLSLMGHPIHPILQAMPAAMLPASTTFDALALFSENDEALSAAGRYSLIFGLISGVGAAATGALDYYEIENEHVSQTALYHGLSNAALMALYLASLKSRKNGRAGGKALLLSILGASLIGLSGYLGGKLVYEHGVRVGEDEDGIPGAS